MRSPSPVRSASLAFCMLLFASAFGCDSSGDGDGPPKTEIQTDTEGADTESGDTESADTESSREDTESMTDGGADVSSDVMEDDDAGAGCDGTQSVVQFDTSDGVTLEADYIRPSKTSAGAAALFHMIPPNHDRTNYPQRALDKLAEKGIAVLNVDRRGAGGSEGNPREAYQGPNGKLDVEAAVRFLTSGDRECPSDSAKIVLVGASNGTTSVLDYTVARQDTQLPDPSAIIWMSPGRYTIAQNRISNNRNTLDTIPIFWIHPDNEPWSNQFKNNAPSGWKFKEIQNGRHGTLNFDNGTLEQEVLPPFVDWVAKYSM